MSSAELWQVYDRHGKPVAGHGEAPNGFEMDFSLYMANAHVWLFRQGHADRQVLLQTRAKHLPRKPGYLHASASGHVNVDEQPLDAAIRETSEELGVEVHPDVTRFLFMQIGGSRGESYNYVYAYDATAHTDFGINHEEVESVSWVALSDLKKMATEPEKHRLIDLGDEYFDRLLQGISAL